VSVPGTEQRFQFANLAADLYSIRVEVAGRPAAEVELALAAE
jgi:hypothetical protein